MNMENLNEKLRGVERSEIHELEERLRKLPKDEREMIVMEVEKNAEIINDPLFKMYANDPVKRQDILNRRLISYFEEKDRVHKLEQR